MEKGTFKLAQNLLSRIYTTKTLKLVSETLEELTQNKTFLSHATSIVTDGTLTDSQKKTQLLYLIRTIEIPVLFDYFSDELAEKNFWIFNAGKINYLDKFVQEFQRLTESVDVVFLTTAIPLSGTNVRRIAKDLSATFGHQIVISHEINKNILGGAIIKVENHIFDYSVRTKFHHFEHEWLSSLEKTDKKIGRNQPES